MTIDRIRDSEDTIFFKIKGISMRPFFKTGDIFIAKKTPIECMRIGDIVSYKSTHHKKEISHRLIMKIRRENGYLLYTRGDACFGLDEPIDESAVLGKAVGVIKNGRIINLVGHRQRLTSLLIILFSPWIMIARRLASRIYHRAKG